MVIRIAADLGLRSLIASMAQRPPCGPMPAPLALAWDATGQALPPLSHPPEKKAAEPLEAAGGASQMRAEHYPMACQ